MLHWRIILGVLFVTAVLTLAWFDFHGGRPGLVMSPLALGGACLAAGELVRMFEHDPNLPSPSRYVVVPGAIATVAMSCVPMLAPAGSLAAEIGRVGWVAIGLAGSCLAAFSIEMLRYRSPGSATARLALAVFGIAYAGGLMGFVVQLRLLNDAPWDTAGRWGMVALLSMIVVVKSSDIGAYVAGRLFGRTRMAPVLSPGKTWEGFIGGLALATVAAMFMLGPVARWVTGESGPEVASSWLGSLVYALLVGGAGVAGDLAVSLLKRDAGLKNSSSWMPGFGGVLDILDSVLFAAPVAYLLWLARVVGP
ncbi:phosphatidate cytidylyltransferase [Botrimarina hoheduenensis]|uniref:Phosphatidate cytidylyltransferase n=1 Tax=Botrimarina hoheduenensis TaxID=2528000 RepID=A0A5C5WAX1_9BACT|nr:phosphatidate cytidylyltransferase [Botrimarina hoheduenensis]TWT47315.1 Phosphatidate cytidylyltransferase [Botrimarina hoheduenensis]